MGTNSLERFKKLLESRLAQLSSHPSPTDPEQSIVYLSLFIFFKTNPGIGAHDSVWPTLLAPLRGANRGASGAAYASSLCANILYKSFSTEYGQRMWPVEFVQAYLDDALGDRLWSDDENNRLFIDRVVSIFADPTDINIASSQSIALDFAARSKVRETTLALVAHHLSLPQPPLKGIIKLMTSCCLWPAMRLVAVGHLDAWLGDSTVPRLAVDLMRRLAATCNTDNSVDLEVVRQFCRLRVTAAQSTAFHESLQKLLSNQPAYAPAALREFVLFDIFGFVDLNNANAVPDFDNRLLRLIAGSVIPPMRVEAVVAGVVQELIWNIALAPVLKPSPWIV